MSSEKKKAYNKEYMRKSRLANPSVHRERVIKCNTKLRKEILNALGGKCVRCGFSDPRALQIDHVHGDGSHYRLARLQSHKYYRLILKAIQEGSQEYQLLCANCNWIKRAERKEYNYTRRIS